MKIQLHTENRITVSGFGTQELDIHSDHPDLYFGAMPMFVAALATCTHGVLASYGERVAATTDDLEIRLQWEYGEKPRRIRDISMAVHWPQLPDSRLDAAMRAAAQCTLHKTLDAGVEVETDITNSG